MRELSAVAERLRVVRDAELRFLGLWATQEALVLPGIDRLAAGLAGAIPAEKFEENGPQIFGGRPDRADEHFGTSKD